MSEIVQVIIKIDKERLPGLLDKLRIAATEYLEEFLETEIVEMDKEK